MFMRSIILLSAFSTFLVQCENDWVWNDNNRENRKLTTDEARYNVNEDFDSLPNRPFLRPQRPHPQLGGGYDRPIPNRPIIRPNPAEYSGPNNNNYNRPGGVYGNVDYPSNYGRPNNQGILTGPVPSWVREGPFKNFDTCKCTEKFNCRSPGLSYGHCDVGKKYCCYNRNKVEDLGSDYPSRPVHSPENGILVGPGGPVDRPIGRPPVGLVGRPPVRPFHRPGRPGIVNPNNYGGANGVLYGPRDV